MSGMEHFKGVLKKIERLNGETLEEQCKRLLDNRPLPHYFDSYTEYLEDNHYHDMTIQNGDLYQVEELEEDPSDEILIANRTKDDKIAFEIRYYNGSMGFNEAIGEALKNLDKS